MFFQCALNLALFGPSGSVIIDPTDKGLVVHTPSFSGVSSIRLISKGRTLFRHGLWLVDVVHGLDKSTTSITDAKLEDTFKVSKKRELLVVERKLEHDMPAYRSRYIVKFKRDGSATISLARKKLEFLSRLKQFFKLKEVSVTIGKLEFTGINCQKAISLLHSVLLYQARQISLIVLKQYLQLA